MSERHIQLLAISIIEFAISEDVVTPAKHYVNFSVIQITLKFAVSKQTEEIFYKNQKNNFIQTHNITFLY